jgi:para-aminobenzoate synthetase component I
MLNWARRFNIFCFMDHNQYAVDPHRYECVLAAGVASSMEALCGDDVAGLGAFLQKEKWAFGHVAYEEGYRFFDMPLTRKDPVGFPLVYFFHPQYVLRIERDRLYIEGPDADRAYREIMDHKEEKLKAPPSLLIRQRLSREAYIQKVKALQQHILRGDCYEVNFCQEFFAEGVELDPVNVYRRLNALSPNPFSVLYRLDDKYLICASPERFLYKKGDRIVSQPIKGTARRVKGNEVEDELQKKMLRQSAKERAENVMVVDLVRNDLSRVCREGSVRVDELFGVYTYPQVHQMISTISGQLKEESSFPDILKATFPMGSMTGAPKKRVMELIRDYEEGSRGIFSGTVGYINPKGDFDFNVVIRSIMYNASSGYLSYQVGSGITFYCDAEKEWDECLLKGEAIKKVLTD